MDPTREDLAKKYQKTMALRVQVDLNLAFDELVSRVILEKPTAPIQVRSGDVQGDFRDWKYTFTF